MCTIKDNKDVCSRDVMTYSQPVRCRLIRFRELAVDPEERELYGHLLRQHNAIMVQHDQLCTVIEELINGSPRQAL